MRAHLGDHLVIERTTTGAAKRDGEIVGLHHEDGTPPYDVRWSDTDEVTLVFPGPDAHIQRLEHGRPGSTNAASGPDTAEAEAMPGRTPGPGDIGRRVAVERRRQRLSREETARRARMSPGYLEYLEERPADPSVATLIRLADVLGTTVATLRGGGVDLPPGQGPHGPPHRSGRFVTGADHGRAVSSPGPSKGFRWGSRHHPTSG